MRYDSKSNMYIKKMKKRPKRLKFQFATVIGCSLCPSKNYGMMRVVHTPHTLLLFLSALKTLYRACAEGSLSKQNSRCLGFEAVGSDYERGEQHNLGITSLPTEVPNSSFQKERQKSILTKGCVHYCVKSYP